MHPTLLQQLQALGIDPAGPAPTADQLRRLLDQVDATYTRTLSAYTTANPELAPLEDRSHVQAVMQSLAGGSLRTDLAGVIASVSPDGERLLHYAEADLVGRPVFDVFRPTDSASIDREAFLAAIRSGQAIRDQRGWIIRPDGQEQPVVYRLVPVFRSTSISGAMLVMFDIAPLERLGRAQHRRDAILEAIGIAAGHFLNSPAWEDGVPPFLERIGEAAEASRAILVEDGRLAEPMNLLGQRFEWLAPGVAPLPSDQQFRDLNGANQALMSLRDSLAKGTAIAGSQHTLPPAIQKIMRQQDVEAMVLVPVFVGSLFWGIISLQTDDPQSEWSEAEVDALRTAANVIGAAIRARKSEIEMGLRERHYQTLVNGLKEVVFQTDGDGRLTLLNQAWTDITGYDMHESLGRDYAEYVHPDDVERVRELITPPYAGSGEVVHTEFRCIAKAGNTRWLECRANRVFDVNNQTVGTIGTLIDVTKRKEAEAAARRREAILEVINFAAERFLRSTSWEQSIPEMLERLGSATGVSRVYLVRNHPSEQGMMGELFAEWCAEGIAGVSPVPSEPFSYRALGLGRWAAILSGGQPVAGNLSQFLPLEQEILARRGLVSIITVPVFVGAEWWGVIVLDDCLRQHDWTAVEVEALQAAASTIGAAVRTTRDQAAIREREQQYSQVISHLKEVIFQTDMDGNWRFLNPAWQEITGFSVAESVGLPCIGFVHPDNADQNHSLFLSVIRGDTEYCHQETRLRTREGSYRWVEVIARRSRDTEGQVTGAAGTINDITDRRLAEEALRRSEAYYRSLTNNAMDIVIILEPDGTVRYASPAVEATLGISPDDARGRSIFSWIHAYDLPLARSTFFALADTSHAARILVRVRHADGSWRTLEVIGTNLLNDEAVRGIVVNARDITSRSEAEAATRRHEDVLSALYETSVGLIERLDINDLLSAIIQRAGSLFDTTHGFVSLVSPDGSLLEMKVGIGLFRGSVGHTLQRGDGLTGQAWETSRPAHVDDYVAWPGRRSRTSSASFHALMVVPLQARHEVIGVIGLADARPNKPFSNDDVLLLSRFAQIAAIALDNAALYSSQQQELTERRAAETALRQSEEKTQALLNAIPDMMIRLTPAGDIIDYRYGKDDLTALVMKPGEDGRNIRDLLGEAVYGQYLAAIDRVLRTGAMEVFEYQSALSQGTIDMEARIVRSSEDEALAIVRDITEQKRVDRLKNEFVSTVSHELRTPLTSIRGSLGLIAGGIAGPLPERAGQLVDIAYKNSERLVRLINDILDIEKIESGKMDFELAPIEVAPVVLQAIEANRSFGEQFGVTFQLRTAGPVSKVSADPDRLMQVLTNLLSNAAKFSPPNGVVDILVERRARVVRVAVHDDGPGIPEDFRDQIFQKFAQADASNTRDRGGTGLGLSIVKAIVDRLGGTTWFESSKTSGTTFIFELPTRPETVDAPPATPASVPPTRRVLVVEDDPEAGDLLSTMLREDGYQTDLALTAGEARGLLATHTYAAMTLDLVLPDQDGISFIREIREQEQEYHLPIIVVSISARRGHAELNGDAVAVIDWLEKPVQRARLLQAVRQATRHQPPEKPRILHIEDDPDIRQLVRMILDTVAEVDAAASLETARDRLHTERYDLVILDLTLPDGSGFDLLPLISRCGQPTPVMLFTAAETGKSTAEHIAAALVKSRTTNEDLLATIQSLIQQCSPRGPQAAGPPSGTPPESRDGGV